MYRLSRHAALLSLLIATLLLRGLLPLGTMPGRIADGGFGIVLCTPQGMVAVTPAGELPAQPDASTECPYAFALGMGAALPSPPLASVWPADRERVAPRRSFVPLPALFRAHRARGPPNSV